MRVLVTGAGGQLGSDVVAVCEAAGDQVIAADHAALDVGDRDAVLGAVTTIQPDAVVHAAAWTAVDACEADPERAFRDNAMAARHVADGCRRAGAHLCFVSTDYVFDGTKDGPYVEWDDPRPLSVYGRSKLAGEREVAALAPGSTIVRTSWVCGLRGSNMVRTVLRLAAEPDRALAFVDDQRGCPTFTADLAVAVRRLTVGRFAGTYHVTNAGPVSWFEFVGDVLEAAGHDRSRVRPITTAELDPPRPAPRPANSVLDNAALRAAGLPAMRHYREPLRELVEAMLG
jgi:dTDP-4-dehydrorhamnose reductase